MSGADTSAAEGRAGTAPAGGIPGGDAEGRDAEGSDAEGSDAEGRVAAVISPLRRTLLAAARERAALPEIPDAQIEVVRALLPSTGSAERGPAELAEALHLSRPTVSNLLRAMEADGLVERRRAAGDGRRIVVVASARATDLFRRFDQAAGDLLREALRALDPADREAVAVAVPALERLAAALRETDR